MEGEEPRRALSGFLILPLLLSLANLSGAQERKVDPTWLHRYAPEVKVAQTDLTSGTCHYKPLFGDADRDKRAVITVVRFGEATLDAGGSCESVQYDRQEELYFVLEGNGLVEYSGQSYPMRANDFTYIAPGVKHVLKNRSQQPLRAVVMTFKIPPSTAIGAPPPQPKIVNLEDLKEQTVSGHPSSVLYKLMAGRHTATRDAIDQAYVVVSLFWMDFAPGGTNFPHHHESAEEIYLVVDGEGEMVAGGGMDGIEGRHSAKAGDAYYFRPNATVGFYNANKPGAKAHILAVRSWVPIPEPEE